MTLVLIKVTMFTQKLEKILKEVKIKRKNWPHPDNGIVEIG